MLDTALSHGQPWQVEDIKEMEAVESHDQLRPGKKKQCFYCYLDFIHTISKKRGKMRSRLYRKKKINLE